jgi:zinc protease
VLAPTVDLPDRFRPAEPPQRAERRIVYADPRVSEPNVIRSYLAPERNPGDQKEAAALTILAELLGGSGTTSVLARALTFDAQVAVYASAFYDGTALDQTTFGLIVVPLPGVAPAEAEAFLETGPDPEAFARIKTQIRAHEIYSRDSASGLARRYGEALTTGLTVADIEAWPDVLQSVTADDVMAVAKKVLDRRQAVTGWLVKEEPAE